MSKTMKNDRAHQSKDGVYYKNPASPPVVDESRARALGGNVDGLSELAVRQQPPPVEIARGTPVAGAAEFTPIKPSEARTYEPGVSAEWRKEDLEGPYKVEPGK